MHVYDFHQDIRTYGRRHEDYYDQVPPAGRGVHPLRPAAAAARWSGTRSGEAPLVVRTFDQLTFGEEIEVPVDLLVLATGLVARDISEADRHVPLRRGAGPLPAGSTPQAAAGGTGGLGAVPGRVGAGADGHHGIDGGGGRRGRQSGGADHARARSRWTRSSPRWTRKLCSGCQSA